MAKILDTIAQFIPILLLFILVSQFKELALLSNTILGKVVAICIIIFYTTFDKLLGAVICLLFILYYQSDVVENMLNMEESLVNDIGETDTAVVEEPENPVYLDEDVNKDKEKEKEKMKEGMENYTDLYGDDSDKTILINADALQTDFRKKNCTNGELMNKDVKINYEMTEHVFPQIKFRRGFCNPCSKDCDYSITDQKMATEDKLIRSIK